MDLRHLEVRNKRTEATIVVCVAMLCVSACFGREDDGKAIVAFDFQVPQKGLLATNATHRDWINCRLQSEGRIFEAVGIHLKGISTFQGWDEKPSLTVKFNQFEKDQRWRGLRKIHLNNSAQDPTYLCQYIGSLVAERCSVPCPQSSHAELRFNGRDLGLYVLVEGATQDFLQRVFGNREGTLFEAHYNDIDGPMEVDFAGRQADTNAPQSLAVASRITDLAQRRAAFEAILDLDAFSRFLALEAVLRHWDGYAGRYANYRLYHDPVSQRMHFILHGMDNLFAIPIDTVFKQPRALVARALLEIPEERARFASNVATISTNAIWNELPALIDERQRLVRPILDRTKTAPDFDLAAAGLKQRIAERITHIRREVARLPGGWQTNGTLVALKRGLQDFPASRANPADGINPQGGHGLSALVRQVTNSTLAIPHLRLELLSASERIVTESTNWFSARLSENSNAWAEIDVRLKGRTRRRGLFDQPCLTIKARSGHFHGMSKFHLENDVGGSSQLAQYLTVQVMRRAGLPAPQAEFVTLTINGKAQGVYLLVEGATSGWLGKTVGESQGSLYEGERADVDGRMDHDGGPLAAEALLALATAARGATNDLGPLRKILDADEFARFLAVEMLLPHTDGYALNTNNYRVYQRNSDGKFIFLLHGFDLAFRLPEFPVQAPMKGIVAQAFLASPEGRLLYRQVLRQILDQAMRREDLSRDLAEAFARTAPHFQGPEHANGAFQAADDLLGRVLQRVRLAHQQLNVLDHKYGYPRGPATK